MFSKINYLKDLRILIPEAKISIVPSKSKTWKEKGKYTGPYITFEIDMRKAKDFDDREHDAAFRECKRLFGK